MRGPIAESVDEDIETKCGIVDDTKVTKVLIAVADVEKISKEKTAIIIPNAVGVSTASGRRHVFGSLLSRDNTWRLMHGVWRSARSRQPRGGAAASDRKSVV